MRPHRLCVTAFGAFGGTVEVCFDDLAQSGLFLLHGETGAGKTTLLDALGFALYGRVPGERGKARRLRSDHAAPGTPTEVQLEATMGGRRMRLTRKPEQLRPKRRGGGTTTEQAKLLLEECDGGSGRAVSTRAGEADDEIKDLMGMSAEQFFQVVLLPQGQFAQFLHADADHRRRLLQQLFATDRFSAVEQWLAERRRTTAGRVEQARQGIAERAAHIVRGPHPPAAEKSRDPVDAGDNCRGGPAGPSDDLPSPAWAEGLAATAAAQSAACAGQVGAHRATLDQAQDALRDADRLAGRQRRRAEALRTRDHLAEAVPALDALRQELDAAVRAAEVIPSLTEAERAAAALAAARAAEEQARAALAAVPGAHGVRPGEAAAGLRAHAEQQVTALGRLEALRSLADQAADEDTAAAAARALAAAPAAEAPA